MGFCDYLLQKLYRQECGGFVVEEHIGNFYLNLDDSTASEVQDTYSWCNLMQKGDRLVLPGSYGVPVNFNLPRPIQGAEDPPPPPHTHTHMRTLL